jgi:hypothetical protein
VDGHSWTSSTIIWFYAASEQLWRTLQCYLQYFFEPIRPEERPSTAFAKRGQSWRASHVYCDTKDPSCCHFSFGAGGLSDYGDERVRQVKWEKRLQRQMLWRRRYQLPGGQGWRRQAGKYARPDATMIRPDVARPGSSQAGVLVSGRGILNIRSLLSRGLRQAMPIGAIGSK